MLKVSTRHCGREGNYEFSATAPVAASAERVYSLVDWADEDNARRQLGDEVSMLDGDERRFRLVLRNMSGLHFDYDVTEAVKPRVYAHKCVPTPIVGHLEWSEERYEIEPDGDDGCSVTLTILAQFEPDLGELQTNEVVRNMTVACHNAVAKLKPFAEYGVGTAKAAANTRLMPLF